MKVGYARTSSIDGSQRTGLETQIAILKRHGCERIFSEEQSGTSTEKRLQLKETSKIHFPVKCPPFQCYFFSLIHTTVYP